MRTFRILLIASIFFELFLYLTTITDVDAVINNVGEYHVRQISISKSLHRRDKRIKRRQNVKIKRNVNDKSGECAESYMVRISEHCRYPGMQDSCYKTDDDEAATGVTNIFSTTSPNAVKLMAKNCCSNGWHCTAQKFEQLCCRTPKCVKRCYGADFFTRRQEIRQETAEKQQVRRGSEHFRFLDVLTKPNPIRRLHGHDHRGSVLDEENSDGDYDI